MFKLMENELDRVYSSLSKTLAFLINVETFAGYILEDDDRKKYTKEMIAVTEEILEKTHSMTEKIETEQECIETIKDEILELL